METGRSQRSRLKREVAKSPGQQVRTGQRPQMILQKLGGLIVEVVGRLVQ
jgi:hypothetical protein